MKTSANFVKLQTRLYPIRFDGSKDTSENIDSMYIMCLKIYGMNSSVPYSLQVATVLSSFVNVDESSYGPVVSAIKELELGEDQLSWDRDTARLLQKYSSRNKNGPESKLNTVENSEIFRLEHSKVGQRNVVLSVECLVVSNETEGLHGKTQVKVSIMKLARRRTRPL